jgi:hypothetical protein
VYPSQEIASSWDPEWGTFKMADCTGIPKGDPMPLLSLKEGDSVECVGKEDTLYHFTGGQLREYPEGKGSAFIWDPDWENYKSDSCIGIPRGADMQERKEGDSVKCFGEESRLYRYTGGQLRLYPNEGIAFSWDPDWHSAETQDCSGPPIGAPMPFISLEEGDSVKCNGEGDPVFRFTVGQLRYYPTPEIASSWDPDWENSKKVNCTGIPRGGHLPLIVNHPLSFGYRPEDDAANSLEQNSLLFDLTDSMITDIAGKSDMESDYIYSETIQERSNSLSVEVGVDVNFKAFSASSSVAVSKLNSEKIKYTSVDHSIIAGIRTSAMRGLRHMHYKALNKQARKVLLESEPQKIVELFGPFYATKVTEGAMYQSTALFEMTETTTRDDIKTANAMSFKGVGFSTEVGIQTSETESCTTVHIKVSIVVSCALFSCVCYSFFVSFCVILLTLTFDSLD